MREGRFRSCCGCLVAFLFAVLNGKGIPCNAPDPWSRRRGCGLCEVAIAFRATMSTHGIVAGEVFPHHVGRDDSARRGRDCNGCYLHDALRVQELLYGLKESCID